MGEKALLESIGQRLQRERLQRNWSQEVLAKRSGVSRRTLVQAETGHNTSLSTLLKILIAMDSLDLIEPLLRAPEMSPVERAQLKGKERQRAREKPSSLNEGEWTW